MVLLGVLAWSRRWTSEDAFIYYRIVDNLLDGQGPVFNVGERVEAYTGPLWLGALAFGRALVPASAPIEWIAVVLGILLSVAGLLAVAWAARELWSPSRGRGAPSRAALGLPLGALVVVVLPPFWDYATSGLETGLTFAWLGASFLGLVTFGLRSGSGGADERRRARTAYPLAVAIGVGPLVRPDLVIFALAFLLTLLLVERPRSPWRAVRLVAAAMAIPLAYQIFRMGYFGALVPSTALAKEAGESFWARGWDYLANFVSPYALWLPLAALLGYGTATAVGLWRRSEPVRVLLVAAPVLAGLLHALYVVRVGGDYMHARLLLPSLFAAVMPLAVILPGRRATAAVLAAIVVPWALVCALELRAPAEKPEDEQQLQVDDQRRHIVELWGYRHPVTLDGLQAQPERRLALHRRQGLLLAELAERRRAIVLDYSSDRNRFGERSRRPLPLDWALPRPGLPPVVARLGTIGRVGYAAGPSVHVADKNGLADPIAARVRLSPERAWRPGHEKTLPEDWTLARYAVPGTERGARILAGDQRVLGARRALGCGPLRELVDATTRPLSARRFLANMAFAVRERSLRFSADPIRAAAEVCGRRGRP
ncbi:MAG: hypothetical protein M3088_02560 [Actinomycetota bacterium]|nr:hypothetical protein [Actinomycetota bacterium]